MRKRIAVSIASAVLAVGGATAAFAVASTHGGTPQMTTGSPSVTASPSPSSGGIPPTTSNSPSSNAATAADPHEVIEAAWLAPAQLPFANTFSWKAVQAGLQGSAPIGQPLTATVFYVAKDTPFQALTMCGDPANLLGRTVGAQHREFGATPEGSGNAASQFVFFFANAASAQQAFAWLQGQYAICLPSTGMTITKTAGDGLTSAAWLSLKGSSGPVDASAYTREYFVLRGSTIAYVSVNSRTTLPTTYNDAAQLSTIAAHLCVYGGPCD